MEYLYNTEEEYKTLLDDVITKIFHKSLILSETKDLFFEIIEADCSNIEDNKLWVKAYVLDHRDDITERTVKICFHIKRNYFSKDGMHIIDNAGNFMNLKDKLSASDLVTLRILYSIGHILKCIRKHKISVVYSDINPKYYLSIECKDSGNFDWHTVRGN